jgi:hypothetical protein
MLGTMQNQEEEDHGSEGMAMKKNNMILRFQPKRRKAWPWNLGK